MMPRTETECPACGYEPLHHRSTTYGEHVVVSYKCALCGNAHDAEHAVRGSELGPPSETETEGGGLQRMTSENSSGVQGSQCGATFRVRRPTFDELSTVKGRQEVSGNPVQCKIFHQNISVLEPQESLLYSEVQNPDEYISIPGAKT
jgi:hypothetical protein